MRLTFRSLRYGIRYLAMTLRTCLAEKFPNAGQDEILRVSSSNKFTLSSHLHLQLRCRGGVLLSLQQQSPAARCHCKTSSKEMYLIPFFVFKVVGNLIYYRYMNPAIVAPDAFDIVDVSVDKSLSVEQVGYQFYSLFLGMDISFSYNF